MVCTNKDKKEMPEFTTDVFTSGITNNSINWDDKINFDGFYTWCPHLLPCGLCSRTDRPCPKHQGGSWQPYVTWTLYNSEQQTIIGATSFTTGEHKND